MILRVYRTTAAAGERGKLLAHLRDVVYPAVARTDGIRSFQAGIAERGDDLELVLISTWRDFDAVVAAIGPDLARPRWLGDIAAWLRPLGADHYELVGEEIRGVFPLSGGVVRVLRGTLTEIAGETFFDFARRRQQEQLETPAIIASHIGRRIDGRSEEAINVVVWRDAEAPAVMGGSPTEPAAREAWEPFFASWEFSAYDALARVPARRADADAVLLADDGGTLIFANAAAGRLVGRPPARLLGRRVEDLTAPELRPRVPDLWRSFLDVGRQDGPFRLALADGTSREVHYAARANTPWPGYHVSVLTPAGTVPDVDRALSAAGLIVRYDAPDAVPAET